MLISFYNTFLYEPLFNILIFFYNLVPIKDVGFAIILLTAVVRLVLFPLSKTAIRSQRKLQTLKPKIDKLKEEIGDDKEAFGKATMELYKKEKINPMSSCLPILIQLPILIAVYQVFRQGLSNGSFDVLYSFVAHPGVVNHMFLGFINLAEPNAVLAVIAGLAQFIQSKMLMSIKGDDKDQSAQTKNKDGKPDIGSMMNKQMVYFMPLFTVFIGLSLPSGLVLYWMISIVLTVVQQYFVFNEMNSEENKPQPENA